MEIDFPILDSPLPFPAWGNLGICAYDIDADHHPHREPMSIRCWRIFSDLLKTANGRKLVAELEQDERVNAHKERMISSGSGGERFEINNLAMWYLWLLNRSSKEVADNAIERFLDSSQISVHAILGLDGITVTEPIQLTPQMKLSHVDELPECDLKDQIYREHFSHTLFKNTSSVQGFLVGNCEVPKFCNDDPNTNNLANLWKWFQNAYDSALLLNCIDGVASLPSFQTTVVGNETPFGPFNGSGGGAFFHGRAAGKSFAINSIDSERFTSVASAFESKKHRQKDPWRMALTRLAFAKTAVNPPDEALELGIAIEMMLQHDNRNREQLSLTFRLRGAWLLEPDDAAARSSVYEALKFLYNCRSEVAHTGSLSKKSRQRMESERPQLHSIGERVAYRLLVDPPANWDDVILSC